MQPPSVSGTHPAQNHILHYIILINIIIIGVHTNMHTRFNSHCSPAWLIRLQSTASCTICHLQLICKLRVDGKRVGECLHQHTHTDGWTTRKYNASNPIYWMGNGIKPVPCILIKRFSTGEEADNIHGLQLHLFTLSQHKTLLLLNKSIWAGHLAIFDCILA